MSRKLLLGFLGLLILILGYMCFFGIAPTSFDAARIYSLSLGPVKSSESLLFYNAPDSMTTVMEGDRWKTDRYLHQVIKPAPNTYPGISFNMRESIPQDAQLVVVWRAKGNPNRILIDITDGSPPTEPVRTGENYYVYANTPGEEWSTTYFPLSAFERNPIQPQNADGDGRFNTEGIQRVSITFFPESDFTLDVREIRFVWKSRQWSSLLIAAITLLLGLLLWWRTTEEKVRFLGHAASITNAAIARTAFVLASAAAFYAPVDLHVAIFALPSLLTFAGLWCLILVDDFWQAKGRWSKLWLFRYLAVALGAWLMNFTHNVALIGLLLTIAYVPLVFQPSHVLFFSVPVIAVLSLVIHPQLNLLAVFLPGTMVIGAITIIAFLAREIFEHQQAAHEVLYLRALTERVLDNTSEAVYIIDQEGKIEVVNKGFETLAGRPREEIVGRSILELVHEDDHALLFSVEDAAASAPCRQYDLRFLRPNGDVRTGLIRQAAIYANGRLTGYQAVATDITERKLEEEERERLVTELQTALAEVKTLSGLLPICASCKKIRDDNGYWNQIEQYIRAHSQAQFTHGICPECIIKLYPEMILGGEERTIKNH